MQRCNQEHLFHDLILHPEWFIETNVDPFRAEEYFYEANLEVEILQGEVMVARKVESLEEDFYAPLVIGAKATPPGSAGLVSFNGTPVTYNTVLR